MNQGNKRGNEKNISFTHSPKRSDTPNRQRLQEGFVPPRADKVNTNNIHNQTKRKS